MSKNQSSIKRKLFKFLSLTGLICTGLIFTSHTLLIDYIHDELHREQLQSAANRLSNKIENDKNDTKKSTISNHYLSQYYAFIEDSHGKYFTSEDIKPNIELIRKSRKPGIFHILDNGLSTLGYNKTFEGENGELNITIIERDSYSPGVLDKLHILIWTISFTILAVITIIIFFGITVALRPLKRMSTQLSALKKGSRRRLDEDVPEEFSELVKHLNRLLESYEKKLNRSRHLAADISHSLKTPIAVMNSVVSNEAIPTTIINQLKGQLSEMHELIDTQMRKTEISGQYTGKATPVIEKTLALVDVISRIYPSKKIHLRETLPRELVWPIDERDFNEVVGNVLDNAGKWCYEEAYLYLSISDDTLTILIEDDGPGVASHHLSDLTKRQKRLDEKTPGYGLGLSIVEEIINDYAGAMHFSVSPLGGLRVLIQFPLII
ncbi:GHKL domain-containing protein [Marinobacter sp. 1-3A]|uniref:ATP-binding protein n=1 Tax=Marinobacter sp. 1-3A TaxID=2582920 RepID=UPI0019063CB2|nr:ATP-binding protein [Marinobacter sp. 1-3A]MBK1872618.1 GHKL domain-containing protein [Marinobacter sp. 1-3A]